jgi:hypothetical protein
LTPQQALDVTRSYRQIENGLHWMLDVHFDEDLSRAREDNAPAKTAILNRIVKNILQIADLPKVPSAPHQEMRIERRYPHQRIEPYVIALASGALARKTRQCRWRIRDLSGLADFSMFASVRQSDGNRLLVNVQPT